MWHFLLYSPFISIQVFAQPLIFALKGIPPHVKYEKNLLKMPVSLLFSQR